MRRMSWAYLLNDLRILETHRHASARTFRRSASALALALALGACSTSPVAPGQDEVRSDVPAAEPDTQSERAASQAPPSRADERTAEPAEANPPLDKVTDGTVAQARAESSTFNGSPRTEEATPSTPAESEAAPLVIDPLQPEARINPNDHAAQTDLWDRVRAGYAMPDLEGPLVRAQERWYASRSDYVQRMTERGGRYLFHIMQEVERRGLPSELALLPFIESAFNPEALSSARASGIWQFIPSTGRNFDLKQNVFRDDRRDVLASTRAALDYLEKLHGMFGDWHLALAAYNWGEGNVGRAIARNRRAGKSTDYSSLKMPNETRHYVPKLQAVKNLVARPNDFALTLPLLANHPYFLSVPIQRDIDVDLAAELAGLSVAEFRALNPQMNKPVILAAGTPQVLLPYDNANRFVTALPQHQGQLASWTAWVTPKTLKPAEAALAVGMNETDMRQINVIPDRMLIKAGSTLLVPRADHRHADVSEHLADNATIALAPDGPQPRRVTMRASRNDTVASIARRYGIGAEQVAYWNSVTTSTTFRPGQKVIVFVPGRSASSRAAAPASSLHKSRPAAASRAAAPAKRPRHARN